MSEEKALKKKGNIVEETAMRVAELEKRGELILPADYVPQNALKSAWLVLQGTVDRNKKPALEVCSKESIALALLDTVVQGLDPGKDQVYYIVYGNKLTAMRSYFGSMALAMRVYPSIKHIEASPIWDGDEYTPLVEKGMTIVIEHKPGKNFKDDTKITHAYCMAMDENRSVLFSDLMTMEQIKKAWAKSAMKPVGEKGDIRSGTTHEQFTEKMATKTVINRLCKKIINQSTDGTLVMSIQRQEMEFAEAGSEDMIEAHAMQEPIDIELPDSTAPRGAVVESEMALCADQPDPPATYTCTKCGNEYDEPYCGKCKVMIKAQGELL